MQTEMDNDLQIDADEAQVQRPSHRVKPKIPMLALTDTNSDLVRDLITP
jgi:hypothetical protein